MINFTMEAAGIAVEVNAMFESTRTFCKEYICQKPAVFSVTIRQEDIAFEREKSAREDEVEGKSVRNFTDAYLETIAVQRKITEQLFAYDILLFHGSVVAVDGQGYLFTAKSGTGKSTHTRFWRETLGDRAVMVNDDKPFLHMAEQSVRVFGSPWNGKHGLGTKICVPLKAICILERGAENNIQRISGKEALFMLMQQSNRPMNMQRMPKYLELVDKLSAGVVFYRMQCNLDPMAAKVAYEAMAQQER